MIKKNDATARTQFRSCFQNCAQVKTSKRKDGILARKASDSSLNTTFSVGV